MSGRTIVPSTRKARNGLVTGHRRLPAYIAGFVLVLVCVALVGPAFARASYDGDWSVVIVTRGGACEPDYRFGLQIARGMVINDGGGVAAVQGQVTPSGVVKVTVRAGSQWALGSGRLSRNRGGGIWKGQGNSGVCSGTWTAERRG